MTDWREWERLFSSIGHALEGIRNTFVQERNMQIHGWAAVWVTLLSLWAELTWRTYMLILFAIIWVWAMELLNTAVEHAVDLAVQKPHPLAKLAKDAAAGAVFLSSLFAVILGITILWEPLLQKVADLHSRLVSLSLPWTVLLCLAVVWFILILLMVYDHKRKGEKRMIAFAASSLLFLMFFWSNSPTVQMISLFLPIAANLFSRRGWDQLKGLLEVLLSAIGMFLIYQIIT